MYPKFSDMLNDLFGFNLPMPIQTFGLFVAIAFIFGTKVLSHELQRRELQGFLKPFPEEKWIGRSASFLELIGQGFLGLVIGIGFIAGYKFAYHAPDALPGGNQSYVLNLWSIKNISIAIAIGVIFSVRFYYKKEKERLDIPVLKIKDVWPHQRMDTFLLIAVLGGIIGAKIFDGLENWDTYLHHPESFFEFSGLTYYGGLIVATISILIYAHKKNINKWQLADSAAPALMLSYGIGRVGCHMAGDGDWGIVNKWPKPFSWIPDWLWSYTYPHNVSNQGVPILGCTETHCFVLPQGVYPTALYESITCIFLFCVLWRLRKKFLKPGLLFGVYLILNGSERFLIELIRVNNKYHFFGFAPTQAELISFLIFISGVFIIIRNKYIPESKLSR